MTEQKKITVNDFKMWLSGVEEMQDETWTPNQTQWKRIRQKIDDIDDTPISAPVVNNNVTYATEPASAAPFRPYPMEDYSASSGLSLPSVPVNTNVLSPIFATGGAQMTKTPDIMTGGAYDPSHLV